MKILCPGCQAPALPEQVNLNHCLAYCGKCEVMFDITIPDKETVEDLGRIDEAILKNPPRACWDRKEGDVTFIGVSTRHPAGFVLLPASLIGIGVTLWQCIGGQIAGGFDASATLVGLIFLAATLTLGFFGLMASFGRLEFAIQGDEVIFFRGFMNLGFEHEFRLSDVKAIDLVENFRRRGGPPSSILVIRGTDLEIAQGMRPARLHFLLNALRQELQRRKSA
ncbi:MAG: hypothetical protein RL095_1294 [Verrucomicrobiota bacterium]|jgi:hypothetical protein